jgi:hypothetical protein
MPTMHAVVQKLALENLLHREQRGIARLAGYGNELQNWI